VGASRGRGGTGRAGTMAAPAVRPASAAGPALARGERAWEERDGRRLKKPLTCGSHTSVT
jgi:hypothetical protein